MIQYIKNNKKRKNEFNLNLNHLKIIKILMHVPLESYMNQAIYGINKIKLTDGAVPIITKKCSEINNELKTWTLDEQWFYIVTNKLEYIRAYNILSESFKKLRTLNKNIKDEFKFIPMIKNKANHLNKILKDSYSQASKILLKIKRYKSIDLKSKKYPKYIEILKKYKYLNFFSNDISNNNNLGATIVNSATDCHSIKRIFPNKKSGFYWIKPRCSKKSLRVYCDFSIKNKAISIYIWNNNQNPNTEILIHKIQSPDDIRYLCATKGLEAIEISNKHIVRRIKQILFLKGWDLILPFAIPVGYDYGCDRKFCTRSYNSFNSMNSVNIEHFVNLKKNHVEKITSAEMLNTVGFGFDRNKPLLFNMKNKKVSAIICSTNNYGNEDNPLIQNIKCNDTMTNNRNLALSPYNVIAVKCPSFCLQEKNLMLIGTGRYSQNSSVCLAGIHNGLIKNLEGGVFNMNTKPKNDNFRSSKKNGIESQESNEESPYTFGVHEYKEKCPIQIYKNPKVNHITSFIEKQSSKIEDTKKEEKKKKAEEEKKKKAEEEKKKKKNSEDERIKKAEAAAEQKKKKADKKKRKEAVKRRKTSETENKRRNEEINKLKTQY